MPVIVKGCGVTLHQASRHDKEQLGIQSAAVAALGKTCQGVDDDHSLHPVTWKTENQTLTPAKPVTPKAGVPLLHVAGLADNVVPYEENAAILAERYKKLGGPIEVITLEGRGHVCGLKDPVPILEFMNRHTRTNKLPAK